MKSTIGVISLAATLFFTVDLAPGQEQSGLDGHWKLIPEKSANIDPWSHLDLSIATDGSNTTVVKQYDAGNPLDRRIDSMTVNTQGNEDVVPVPPGRWLGEVSMGIYYGPNTKRHVTARMNDSRNELQIHARETVQTAQGAIEVDVKETYTLSADASSLQLNEIRSTRNAGPPLTYTFARVIQ